MDDDLTLELNAMDKTMSVLNALGEQQDTRLRWLEDQVLKSTETIQTLRETAMEQEARILSLLSTVKTLMTVTETATKNPEEEEYVPDSKFNDPAVG